MFKRTKKSETESKNVREVEVLVKERKTSKEQKDKELQRQLVEEIHQSFKGEVNKLLEYAKILSPEESDKQDMIDKANRLQSLGFVNSKEVTQTKEEVERIEFNKKVNKNKKNMINAVNYFSLHYPQYKLITEEAVRRICKKYGLVYGRVGLYKGDVPENNLKEIENFKLREEDKCFALNNNIMSMSVLAAFANSSVIKTRMYKSFGSNEFEEYRAYSNLDILKSYKNDNLTERFLLDPCGLEIVAPAHDFNMEGMKLEGFQIVDAPIEIPKDPIVLQPVLFDHSDEESIILRGRKYYLILTAWGAEANDEDVVSEKRN